MYQRNADIRRRRALVLAAIGVAGLLTLGGAGVAQAAQTSAMFGAAVCSSAATTTNASKASKAKGSVKTKRNKVGQQACASTKNSSPNVGTVPTGGSLAAASGPASTTTPTSTSCASPRVVPMSKSDPQSGTTDGNYFITNDTWNASNYSLTQTLSVCSASNWSVVANMNNDKGDGAVKTYPNVHQDFDNSPQISSFKTISSTFAEQGPRTGIYEYAYDIWLNGIADSGSTEVMIWTDNVGQTPGGTKVGTVNAGGQSFTVWKSDKSYIAFVADKNVTSGSVNLLGFFNYIIQQGWIPSTSTLGQIDFGPELVSTNGANATFRVMNFSITAE